MISEKNSVRQHAKKFRDQLLVSPDWAEQAADVFLSAIPLSRDTVVSVYYPIGSELDPSPLVEKLWEKNIAVCLPVIAEAGRELTFVPWRRESKLIKARFGTYEPEDQLHFVQPDIVVVPLLAFDQTGNRMGYGQGHYDTTLAQLRADKDILAVGFAYAEQAVLLALPTEPHDQKLDKVVTPQRIFDFCN